jgi:hypothetical protein
MVRPDVDEASEFWHSPRPTEIEHLPIKQINYIMKGLLRYGGAIIVLIGVLILALPWFSNSMSNTLLGVGLLVIVVGVIATIFFNRISD